MSTFLQSNLDNNLPEQVFSVKEFNEFIAGYLKSVGQVVVQGEISEMKPNGSFLFMKIKEDDTSVDVFALTYKISGLSSLEVGMMVKVYGTPGMYQKRGSFSLQADRIIPAGEGSLKLAYEKMKKMLESEGLFKADHKRSISKFPENIGLITAKNSQAYADFVKVLAERLGGIKVKFYPVNVQGKNSVKSIINAIDYFNKNVTDLDALVIVRGGGSMEDLLSFNDESLARSIFGSKIPTVVGVGHEKDDTLVDYVADLRASTPSNAAELLVMSRNEAKHEIEQLVSASQTEFIFKLDATKERIQDCLGTMDFYLSDKAKDLRQQVVRFLVCFQNFTNEIQYFDKQVLFYKKTLVSGIQTWIRYFRKDLANLLRLLNSLDYRQILKRGFSITRGPDGKVLNSIKQIKSGMKVTTTINDGTIDSRILSCESEINV